MSDTYRDERDRIAAAYITAVDLLQRIAADDWFHHCQECGIGHQFGAEVDAFLAEIKSNPPGHWGHVDGCLCGRCSRSVPAVSVPCEPQPTEAKS